MQQRPTKGYLAGARVGGIYANLMVQANVLVAAHHSGVHKLLFLGSSCIYPRMAAQPMEDDVLFRGTLEPTNLCGPGENYHPENSYLIPALIRRFHGAKVSGEPEVAIWGSGKPRREFLYVDDMAAASFFVMNLPPLDYQAQTSPMQSHLNVGSGNDVTIAESAHAVGQAVGYSGNIAFDTSKPGGAPPKWMDGSRLNALGWRACGMAMRILFGRIPCKSPKLHLCATTAPANAFW